MKQTNELRIGFIGLGIMGMPMAGHVLNAGYPLTVWNRTASKADPLVEKGARRAASPAALAGECDVVITIVTDGPDVEAVLFGRDGAAEGFAAAHHPPLSRDPKGSASAPAGSATRPCVIDMSTISPAVSQRIGQRLSEMGVDFLDAPVTGGDVGARNATLTIMVGGDAAVFAAHKPLLETMGKRMVYVGPAGSGQMVKACNQILCAVHMIAACEALSLARKTGIDPKTMLDVVTTGAGGSWALENLGRKIVAGDLQPAFMVKLIQKDLRAVMEAATGVHLPLPGTALAMQLFRAVESAGGGDLGTQAMIRAYERLGEFRMDGGADKRDA